MPAFDGTGPMGMGPMTGGGRGWCNPYFRRMSPMPGGFYGSPYPGWQRAQHEMAPWNPYLQGFGAFPRRFSFPRRGLRSRWW